MNRYTSRKAITNRLNGSRQKMMAELLEFWSNQGKGTEKEIMMFAFDQLHQQTELLKKRLEDEASKEQNDTTKSSEQSADSASDVPQTENNPEQPSDQPSE